MVRERRREQTESGRATGRTTGCRNASKIDARRPTPDAAVGGGEGRPVTGPGAYFRHPRPRGPRGHGDGDRVGIGRSAPCPQPDAGVPSGDRMMNVPTAFAVPPSGADPMLRVFRTMVEAARAVALLPLVLAAASLVAGCETTLSEAPNPGVRDAYTPYPRIVVSEADLARALRFDEPVVVRNEEGFITRIDVTARAYSAHTLHIDYRPVFKDARGLRLQPEPGWRDEFMQLNTPERFTIRPPGLDAVDWELQFRWAR